MSSTDHQQSFWDLPDLSLLNDNFESDDTFNGTLRVGFLSNEGELIQVGVSKTQEKN